MINTRVETPHKSEVTSLVHHPNTPLVVSASIDGTFKVWIRNQPNPKSSTKKNSCQIPNKFLKRYLHFVEDLGTWSCRSVADYKDSVSLNSLNFSHDGSLLAVAYHHVIFFPKIFILNIFFFFLRL